MLKIISMMLLLGSVSGDVSSICPPSAACLEDDDAIAIAPTAEDARLALNGAVMARPKFAAAFGITPGATAVLLDADRYSNLSPQLQERGLTSQLRWVSRSSMRQLMEQAGVEQILASLPEAEREQVRKVFAEDGADSRQAYVDIIAHELGHLWLGDAYPWPAPPSGSSSHYGEWAAPDWLDEAAAVAMEGVDFAKRRLGRLCRRYPERDSQVLLTAFFDARHPSQGESTVRARGESAQSSEGFSIQVNPGAAQRDATNEPVTDPRDIYAELVHALVGFMDAGAPSMPVWGSVAATISDGETFDHWLQSRAGEFGLPESQDSLVAALDEWIRHQCERQ